MDKNEEIQLKIAKLNADYENPKSGLSELQTETTRVLEVSRNADAYLDCFDEQFEKITSLYKVDFSLIWMNRA